MSSAETKLPVEGKSTVDTYWKRVARGVRAEMGRQRRNANELVPVLGLTRNTVYRRVNGQVPFNLEQIEAVAAWLGVTVADLEDVREVA